jgi:hypothetical protein
VKSVFKTSFWILLSGLCLVLFIVASYALNYLSESDYAAYLLMLLWSPFVAESLSNSLGRAERYLAAAGLIFLSTILLFGYSSRHERMLKDRRFGFRYGNVTRPFNALVQNEFSQNTLKKMFALLPLQKQYWVISGEDALRVLKMNREVNSHCSLGASYSCFMRALKRSHKDAPFTATGIVLLTASAAKKLYDDKTYEEFSKRVMGLLHLRNTLKQVKLKPEQQIEHILVGFPTDVPLPSDARSIKEEEEKLLRTLGLKFDESVEKIKKKKNKSWWQKLIAPSASDKTP